MATVHSKLFPTIPLSVPSASTSSQKTEKFVDTSQTLCPRDHYLQNAPHLNLDGSLKIKDPKPLTLTTLAHESLEQFWTQGRQLNECSWKWSLQTLLAPFLKYCLQQRGTAMLTQGGFHLIGTPFWKDYLQKFGVQNLDEELWSFSTHTPSLYEIDIKVPNDPSRWITVFLYFLAVQQFSEQLPYHGLMRELGGLLTRAQGTDGKTIDRLINIKSMTEKLSSYALLADGVLEIPLDQHSKLRVQFIQSDFPNFPYQCDQFHLNLMTDDIKVISQLYCPVGTVLQALHDRLLHRYELLYPKERSRFSWSQLWARITVEGPALLSEKLYQEMRDQPVFNQALKFSSLEVQLVYSWHLSLHSSQPQMVSIEHEKALSPFGQLLNRYQTNFKDFSCLLTWMGGLQLLLASTTDSPRCRMVHQGGKTYLDISWKALQRLHLLCEYDLKLALAQLREWLKKDKATCLMAFCEALPNLFPSISTPKLPISGNLSEFVTVCEEIYAALVQDSAQVTSAIWLLEILKVLKQKPVEISEVEKVILLLPSLPTHERLLQATESLVRLCEASTYKQFVETLQKRLIGISQRTADEAQSICLEEFLVSGEKLLVSRAISQIASLQPVVASTFLIRVAPRLTADIMPQILGRVCDLTNPSNNLDREEKLKILQAYDQPLSRTAGIPILASVQSLVSHACSLKSLTLASYDSLVDKIMPPEMKIEQFRKEWEEVKTYATTPKMQPEVLFERLRHIQKKLSLDPKWRDDEQFAALLPLALQDPEVQNSAGFSEFIQLLFTRLETQKKYDRIYTLLAQIKPRQGDKAFHPWVQKSLELWMDQKDSPQKLVEKSAALRQAGHYTLLTTDLLLTFLKYLVVSASVDLVRKEIVEIKKLLTIEKAHKKAYVDFLQKLYPNIPLSQLLEDVLKNLSLFTDQPTSIPSIQTQLMRVATYLREHHDDHAIWSRFNVLFEDLRKNTSWRGAILEIAETLTLESDLKKLKLDHPLFALFLKSWTSFEKKLSDPERIQLGQVLSRVVCRYLVDREEDAALKPLASGACPVAEMRERVLTAVRRPESLGLYARLVFVYALKRKIYLQEPLRWIGAQLHTPPDSSQAAARASVKEQKDASKSSLLAEYSKVVAVIPLKELQKDAKAWKPLLARLCFACPDLMPRLINLSSGNETAFFQECQFQLRQDPVEAGLRLKNYADTGLVPTRMLLPSNLDLDSLLKPRSLTRDTVKKILKHPKVNSLTSGQWAKLISRLNPQWEGIFDRVWQLWLATHLTSNQEDQDLLRRWISVLLKYEPLEGAIDRILVIAEKTSLTPDQWSTLILKLDKESTASLDRVWKYWLKTHPSAESKEEDSELWKKWVNKLTLTHHDQPFVNDLMFNHLIYLAKRLKKEDARFICRICVNFLLEVSILSLQCHSQFYEVLSQLLNNPEIEAKVGPVMDLLNAKEKLVLVDLTMASHSDPKVQEQGKARFFQRLATKQYLPSLLFENFCFRPFFVSVHDQATLWELAEQALRELSTHEEVLQAGRWFTIVSSFSFPFTTRSGDIHLQTHLLPQFHRLLQKMGRCLERSSSMPANPLALLQQINHALKTHTNPLTQGLTLFIDGSLKIMDRIFQQEIPSREKFENLNLLHPLLEQLVKERALPSQSSVQRFVQPSTRKNRKDQNSLFKQLDRMEGNSLDEFQQAILTGIQIAAEESGDKISAESILQDSDDTRAQTARLRLRWIYWALIVLNASNQPMNEGLTSSEKHQLALSIFSTAAPCFEELSKFWDSNYGPTMESLVSNIPSFIRGLQDEPRLREPVFRTISASFSVLHYLMQDQLDFTEKIELLRKYRCCLQVFEEKFLLSTLSEVESIRGNLAKLWLRWFQCELQTLRQSQPSKTNPTTDIAVIKLIIPKIQTWCRDANLTDQAASDNMLEQMPLLADLVQGDSKLMDYLLSLLYFLSGCAPLPHDVPLELVSVEQVYRLIERIGNTKSFIKKNLLLRTLVRYFPTFIQLENAPSGNHQENEAIAGLAEDRVQLLVSLLSSQEMEMLTEDDWRSFLPALPYRVVHQLLDQFIKKKQPSDLLGISRIMCYAGFGDPLLFERLYMIMDSQIVPKTLDNSPVNNAAQPLFPLLCRTRYTQGLYLMLKHQQLESQKSELLRKQFHSSLIMLLIKMMSAKEHLLLLADKKDTEHEACQGKISFRDLALEAIILGCCCSAEPSIIKQTVKLALKRVVNTNILDIYISPLKILVDYASLESLRAMKEEIAPASKNPLYSLAPPVAAPAPNLARSVASLDILESIFMTEMTELQSNNLPMLKNKLIDLDKEIGKKIAEKEKK